MGHDAAVTKKLVLSKVQEAIDAANGAIKAADHVVELHNGLVQKVEQEFKTTDAAIDAAESYADSAHDRVSRLDARLGHFLHALTFRQRLTWLLFGRAPVVSVLPVALEPKLEPRTGEANTPSAPPHPSQAPQQGEALQTTLPTPLDGPYV